MLFNIFILLVTWRSTEATKPPRPLFGFTKDQCVLNGSYYSDYTKKFLDTTTGQIIKFKTEADEVGTQAVSPFPWAVAIIGPKLLKDGTLSDTEEENECSGVLIQDDLVLTAGHCFMKGGVKNYQSLTTEELKKFKILVGFDSFNLTNKENGYKTVNSGEDPEQVNKGHQILGVTSVVVHDSIINYNTSNVLFDLAVATFSPRVTKESNKWVRPICMEDSFGHTIPRNDNGACQGFMVTGYGPQTYYLADRTLGRQLRLYRPKCEWAAIRLNTKQIQVNSFTEVHGEPTRKQLYMMDLFTAVGQMKWCMFCIKLLVEANVIKEGDILEDAEFTDEQDERIQMCRRHCVGPGWSGAPLVYVVEDHWYLYGIVQGDVIHADVLHEYYPIPVSVTCVAIPESMQFIYQAIGQCRKQLSTVSGCVLQ